MTAVLEFFTKKKGGAFNIRQWFTQRGWGTITLLFSLSPSVPQEGNNTKELCF